MSVEATHWVMTQNRTSHGNDRLVLLVFANEADTGTGYCFPSVDLLAHHSCAHRSTVMRCVERLEADGQLLVKRPDNRGRGRHNEYVVVMGRDPYDVADNRGWSRPLLSPAALARRATELDGDPAATGTTETGAEHQDVPSSEDNTATTGTTETGAVDNPEIPFSETSQTATITDQETVADTSHIGRTLVASSATIPSPSPNPNPSVHRASQFSPVDNLPEPVQQLAGRLAAAGHVVRWDIGEQQTALVTAALVVFGENTLVDVAMLEAARKGTPRSARAWVDAWTALAPPPLQHDAVRDLDLVDVVLDLPTPCGKCDPNRWITNSDGLPVAKCPDCHPAFHSRDRRDRHA